MSYTLKEEYNTDGYGFDFKKRSEKEVFLASNDTDKKYIKVQKFCFSSI
jgi:hypothetical protein